LNEEGAPAVEAVVEETPAPAAPEAVEAEEEAAE